MKKIRTARVTYCAVIGLLILLLYSCVPPETARKTKNLSLPVYYGFSHDTANTASLKWKAFFKDSFLVALIDTAIINNQDLNITIQEINIAGREVQARKGEYLPFINAQISGGAEKASRFTRTGAIDEQLDLLPGKAFPEPLGDVQFRANFSWEIDIWKKLRNSKKSAVYKYLSSIEGKNFLATQLISEIAKTYYELLSLDNQLEIVRKTIEIQNEVLEIIKLEKAATRVTELAVRKFEAEVYRTSSMQYELLQRITETENKINFLVGRFPQPIARNPAVFKNLVPDSVFAGLPAQLIQNRPDIRQAEYELSAAKLDVKVARANFFPSVKINAGAGYQGFNPKYLVQPQSLLYTLAGDLIAPVVNRNAIKAAYFSASSRQIQKIFNYERIVLNAFIEVTNQWANVQNLENSYRQKEKQVQALSTSISISAGLFKSARADYMEVLMTQRDALESKFELIEIRQRQMNAVVDIYKALGGGWR